MTTHRDISAHQERVDAARRLGLLDSPPEASFDRLSRLACRILDAPVAVVAITGEKCLFIKSSCGLPVQRTAPSYVAQWDTLCDFVIDQEQVLSIPDTQNDERYRDVDVVRQRGVRAYLGIPLTLRDGVTIGTFSVSDYKPRDWSEDDVELMKDLAASVVTEIELREAGIEFEAQAEATQSERTLKEMLLDSTAEGIYGSDSDGYCRFINRAGAAMLGYEPDEVIGQRMHELIHHSYPDGTPMPREDCDIVSAVRDGKARIVTDHTLWRKDGTSFSAEISASPVYKDGVPSGTVVSFSDVSERRAREERLRESELRKSAILEAALDCIITIDHEGRIVEFNPAAERTFGYTREQAVGSLMADLIIPPDQRHACLSGFSRHLYTGHSSLLGKHIERPAMRADGSIIQTEMAVRRIDLPGREQPLFTAYLRDITERKQAEEDIRFFKHVVDAVGQAVVASDMDRRIIYANKAAEEALGWNVEDVRGRDIRDVVPATDYHDRSTDIGTNVRETGEPWSGEFLLRGAGGATFPAIVTVAPLHADSGEITGTIGIYTDISELKESEREIRLYKHMVDAVGQAVVVNDNSPERRITYWNKAAEVMLGWKTEEVLGRDVREVVPADDFLADVPEIGVAVRSGETWSGSYSLRRRDGSTCPALVSVAPVFGESGELTGIIGAFTDISKLKEIERELRFNKHIVDAVSQAVVVSDTDGRITYWNPAAEHIYGWAADEVFGKQVFDVLPTDSGRETAADITRSIASGDTWSGEFTVKRRDGSVFPAYFTDSPIFDNDGNIIGVLGLSHDITSRKQHERQVAFHKKMLDTVGQAVIATDQQLRITYWNHAAEGLFGWSNDEVNGRSLLELMPPDGAGLQQIIAAIESASRVGSWTGEIDAHHRDGYEFAALAHNAPILDDDGEQVGHILALADITERKATEEALRESNRRTIQILESMGDGFISIETDWSISYVNRQAEHILRRERDDLIGQNIWDAFPGAEDSRFFSGYRESLDGGNAVSFTEYYSPLGMWFEVHTYPTEGGLSIFFRDVTERREAEIAIRNAEERYRSLVEQLPATTYIAAAHDSDKILYVSPQIEASTGYTPEEWIGNPHRWIENLHPDDRATTIGDRPENDDGSRTIEYRIRIKSGEYRWVRDTMDLVRDEDGNPKYWQGIAFDVTAEKDAERAIQESEQRYRTLVEQLPAMTFISAPDDVANVLYTSPQLLGILGYTPDDWVREPNLWFGLVHPDDRERVREQDRISNETGRPFTMEFRLRTRDGRYKWVREAARLIHDDDGNPLYWQGFSFDVSAEKDAERNIRESEQRFRSLFDHNPDAVFSIDSSGRVLTANPAFIAVTGRDLDEPGGIRFVDLVDPDDRERVESRFGQTHRGESQSFHAAIVNHRGDRVQLSITSIPIIVDEEIVGVHVVAQDVTVQQELENQLAHQAFHDSLTGLPNRNLFQSRLDHRLAESQRKQDRFAVLFFDLDDFKVINDSLGHSAGDQFLVEVARRVSTCIRQGDLLARLGGDEFTLLLKSVRDVGDAVAIAERVASVLEDPFNIGGHEVFATTSTGIALGDQDSINADEILRNADLAMYEAKNSGKNQYALFDPSMNSRAWERLTLETEIRQALNRDEFVIHYQPIIDLANGELIGVEALARWHHPERGLLMPGEFIPVAEQSGLILPLGRWIVENAAAQVRAWQNLMPAGRGLRLSLNLSFKQYQHPNLVDELARALERVQLDPRLINLEITENIAMDASPSTTETLARLKELGVQLALDDFGTGFSALSYLRRFPIDMIKIDQSFVGGLGTDAEDTSIVEAVMAAALAMNLHVTAEGIETLEQLEILRRLGCHFGQGYFITRPLDGADMHSLIQQGEYAWSEEIAGLPG